MNRVGRLTVLSVTAVLGIMLGLETHIDRTSPSAAYRTYLGASQQLTDALAMSPVLERALQRDRAQLRVLLTASHSTTKGLQLLRSELAAVQQSAGLTPLAGPGVVVAINYDPSLPVIPGLHYVDEATQLQIVINLLAASGAKGIAVNGQRLVTTTAIRSVSGLSATADPFAGTVQVGGVPVEAPYVISVVGPPQTLVNVLNVEAMAQQFSILDQSFHVHVDRGANGVRLPAYVGPLPGRYVTEVGV